MFLTKNNIINELTFNDIPRATRALNNATDINKKREVMGCFVDPAVIQVLDDTTVNFIFKKVKDATEYKIRRLIKERTGQIGFGIGTKIKLACDFNGFNKGTKGIIRECVRFEEDTFGQGWYVYDIEVPGGFPLLRMYPNEFEVVK